MVSLWTWAAGYKIHESGDDPVVCMGHRTLVLANHQSTADVPILMTAWNPRPGILPNIMWIMDRVFMYTNFGLVSMVHRDFFIQAGRTKREQSLKELRHHLRQWYLPLERQIMVLFPEGGFLHKRKEVSHKFADKNNLPRLEYVTIPRAGAMKVIMDELGTTPNKDDGATTSRCEKDDNFNQNNLKNEMVLGLTKPGIMGDHVEWIVDLTIAYENRQPLHLSDIVCGFRGPCTTHLHYRVFHGSEVPKDTEGMTKWLYDRFIEKDQMLGQYYSTGEFPPRGPPPHLVRPVRQDALRYFIVHLFYIASTLLQIKVFLWMLGY